MLKWATSRWLIDFLGIEKYGVWCPTLKRMEMHPWQWTPKGHPTLSAPTFIESLLALRPQLTSEIKRGFRTSPLRVCRLAYRAAIVYALAVGKRVLYTTPLKALSNQKFQDFCAFFGEEHVGLSTGDSGVRRDASVVVMTTEVFRNMLCAGWEPRVMGSHPSLERGSSW